MIYAFLNEMRGLGIDFDLEQLPLQKLSNDRVNVQRDIIESLVQKHMNEIAKDDDYKLGSSKHLKSPLLIAKRVGSNSSGQLYIINGQHHVEAGVRLGIVWAKEAYTFKSYHWSYDKLIFNMLQKFQKDYYDSDK